MSAHTSGMYSSPPRIAVLMPMFNAAGTLDEALESVVSQSWRDWELIVVDDGSMDGSLEKVMGWCAREPRIRLFTHPGGRHLGRPATRNRTVREATADLVAFLDADDLLFPTALETYVELFARSSNAGLVYGRAEVLCNGHVTGMTGVGLPEIPVDAFAQLARFNILGTSATAVRRCSLGEEPFPVEMPLAQDWACWLVLAREWPLLFIPKTLAQYRYHERGGIASMRRAGREPAYEAMQAGFLRSLLGHSSEEESIVISIGLQYRSSGAMLRGLSALRRGRLVEVWRWAGAAARIAGSPLSLLAALARVPAERRRIRRGLDPPLTLSPWDTERAAGRRIGRRPAGVRSAGP